MKKENILFLGLGVLVAYLIFKPKGAKASAEVPNNTNNTGDMRPPTPIPTIVGGNPFVIGKQYTLTLVSDYDDLKKGQKVTGIYKLVAPPSGGMSAQIQRPVLEVIIGGKQYRIPITALQ